MPPQTALIRIDVQTGMFTTGKPIFEAAQFLERLSRLIGRAHRANAPVVYIQNCGDPGDVLEPGAPGFAIHPAIAPQPSDLVIRKRHPDAFQDTSLQSELDRMGVKRLVLAGMHTAFCVDTTCRRAFSLGYEVILVQDGHSTNDSDLLPAWQIIQHHNQVLSVFFASLQSAAEIAFV